MNRTNAADASSSLSEALAARFRGRSEVVAVYIFGSHARGEADHLSDVDVALLLREGLRDVAHLELRLIVDTCGALDRDDVDVVFLNDAPLRMQATVLTTGQLVVSNDEASRVDYEVLTMSKYWDFKEYLDEYDRHFLHRVKQEFTYAQWQEYHRTLGALAN